MQQNQTPTPQESLATAFATALVDGDFTAAHEMLTPSMKAWTTPEKLREDLFSMFSGYSQSKPERIWFDPAQGLLEQWPNKSPDDVCWAYVGIEGEDFNEAVNVLVTKHDGKLAIADIQWGRP
jgi:hypothetical protein